MPAKRELNPKEAIDHLYTIYKMFLKEGGDPKRFTIRHYNRLNENSHMYIDIYVKKLGGWNSCLAKANIPLGFRQYKDFSKEEIAAYAKKVYKLYMGKEKKGKSSQADKIFRMRDFQQYNKEAGERFSLAIILKRFGSWSSVLRTLEIPIGRSRGLSHNEIIEHVQKVFKKFKEKEKGSRVFSKEMYEKYNYIEDVYISSKLVERRCGTWLGAKKKMKIS